MRTGLVIYSSNTDKLLSFYTEVFDFSVIESEEGYALLEQGEFELVILETKISNSQDNETCEPTPRESTPIKPTFFIDDTLQSISEKVIAKGGQMRKPKSWSFGGRLVCDGSDCEGNIFQLRLKN